MLIQLIVTDD